MRSSGKVRPADAGQGSLDDLSRSESANTDCQVHSAWLEAVDAHSELQGRRLPPAANPAVGPKYLLHAGFRDPAMERKFLDFVAKGPLVHAWRSSLASLAAGFVFAATLASAVVYRTPVDVVGAVLAGVAFAIACTKIVFRSFHRRPLFSSSIFGLAVSRCFPPLSAAAHLPKRYSAVWCFFDPCFTSFRCVVLRGDRS